MEASQEPTALANTAPSRPQFGRVALPAIGYWQGPRRMVTTVMTPVALVDQAGERENWDPLQGTGTNRKEDKKHRKDIAEYLTDNDDYVLGAILVYLDPKDADFVPDNPDSDESRNGVPVMGTLYYRPGAKFMIGDGGHRTGAYTDVVTAHREVDDEVFQRMMRNGQPLIIVLDGDKTNRARDFVTLQNNAKPLNQSVAQSMNRSEALNKVLIEQVIKGDAVPVFGGGGRVEFLADSPGKLSAKIASYKVIRYTSGTLLIGTSHRSAKGWADAVALEMARGQRGECRPVDDLIEFWKGYGNIPAVKSALNIEGGIALLRADTWLTSGSLLYAIAAAVRQVRQQGVSITDAFTALNRFDFTRASNSLHGTLVDPPTQERQKDGTVKDKAAAVRTGREAWESAADMLANFIRTPSSDSGVDDNQRLGELNAAMADVARN